MPFTWEGARKYNTCSIFCENIWEVWWYWQTCPINLLAEKHDLIDIFMHILEVGTSHDLEVLFTMAWLIWYSRNQVVHKSNGIPLLQIWGYAQRLICDYKGAKMASFLSQQPPDVEWATPLPSMYKIKVREWKTL